MVRLDPLAAVAAAVFFVVGTAPLAAQQQDQAADNGVQVTRVVVATDVQDREPVGEAGSFPASVGTVYFYTVFEGDFPPSSFEHVWARDGEEVARVEVNARGPRWRTWSAKQIPADWTGAWTVTVVDAQGNELESVEFTVGDG